MRSRVGSYVGMMALVASSVALLVPAAAAASPESRGADGSSVRDYWTPKRLASARPLPVETAVIPPSAATVEAPVAGPGDAILRAPSPPAGKNPPRVERLLSGEVASPTAYPQSTNGKLFATQGRFRIQCSASVVATRSNNVVLTAGHCIHNRRLGFSRNVMFVPAYSDGARPFGSWVWRYEIVSKQFFNSENLNYDYGAINLKPNGLGRVGSVVGEQGLALSAPREQLYRAIGYPANIAGGELMWNCVSGVVAVDPFSPGPPATGIECDMESGASGGGWTVYGAAGDGPYLASVTSYSLLNQPGVLYGPYLTEGLRPTLRRASRG